MLLNLLDILSVLIVLGGLAWVTWSFYGPNSSKNSKPDTRTPSSRPGNVHEEMHDNRRIGAVITTHKTANTLDASSKRWGIAFGGNVVFTEIPQREPSLNDRLKVVRETYDTLPSVDPVDTVRGLLAHPDPALQQFGYELLARFSEEQAHRVPRKREIPK